MRVGIALLLSAMWSASAAAQAGTCDIAGQKPMTIVRLYFGQDIAGQGPIKQRDWRSFLRESVTPRFPDGFTVYDAQGQWQNPSARKIGRERTKVLEIATVATPDVDAKLSEIESIYRNRFHQQSVGVVTTQGCGAF